VADGLLRELAPVYDNDDATAALDVLTSDLREQHRLAGAGGCHDADGARAGLELGARVVDRRGLVRTKRGCAERALLYRGDGPCVTGHRASQFLAGVVGGESGPGVGAPGPFGF